MGNSNSRSSASTAPAAATSAVVCYYELLGIELTATPEEIKKAYRSKALQLHPDKNMHRVEEATEMFSKIQNAYQVLSDPQERAFYDRHRESILRKGKQKSRVAESGYSVDDLMNFFDASVFKGYGDDPKGFYSVYRDLFAFLEDLEAEESDQPAKYEFASFGSKNSPYEPSLKLFYDKFTRFTSVRTFYEADNYDDHYAENRRHRRAISKENQKLRDAMRREYTDTVRNLALWVRKRDPRWQAYQKERTAQRLQSEEKRKEEVIRRRAEMAESYVAPDWTLNDQCIDDEEFLLQQLNRLAFEELPSNRNDKEAIEEDLSGSEEDEFDDFYCVVCKKVFKNHKQWKNHEQSKKHRTNMQKAGFDLETSDVSHLEDEEIIDDDFDMKYDDEDVIVDLENEDEDQSIEDTDDQQDFTVDNDDTPKSNVPQEIGQKPPKKKVRQPKQSAPVAPPSTKSKSKQKEAKSSASASTLKCTVCSQLFDSRNKLFRHIEETGHAALKTGKAKKK